MVIHHNNRFPYLLSNPYSANSIKPLLTQLLVCFACAFETRNGGEEEAVRCVVEFEKGAPNQDQQQGLSLWNSVIGDLFLEKDRLATRWSGRRVIESIQVSDLEGTDEMDYVDSPDKIGDGELAPNDFLRLVGGKVSPKNPRNKKKCILDDSVGQKNQSISNLTLKLGKKKNLSIPGKGETAYWLPGSPLFKWIMKDFSVGEACDKPSRVESTSINQWGFIFI